LALYDGVLFRNGLKQLQENLKKPAMRSHDFHFDGLAMFPNWDRLGNYFLMILDDDNDCGTLQFSNARGNDSPNSPALFVH